MKQQDVLITIKGVYNVDGDKMTSELYTRGRMFRENNETLITYEETETTGYEGCTTTLQLQDGGGRVTMIRTGSASSHLVLQKGVRNIGSYEIYGNSMEIGVFTDDLAYNFEENSGILHMSYTLDMNALLMSQNQLDIAVSAE